MTDHQGMERCLELARRAAGRTAPNPMVGAVITQQGVVVGEGWHAQSGQAHAEVLALQQAGDRAVGATLYVNLEPCCHQGRTPPCTEAIIAAGIRRVVAGMVDPHPLVNGCGIARLRQAGVQVDVGVLEDRCRALNRAFVTATLRRRPYVTLKAGISLDGRIATVAGESQWISGEQSRSHGHGLRDEYDAILVGSGTALADDPRLSCRVEGGRDPVPVVLDTRARLPASARLLQSSRRPLVFVGRDAPESALPAEVIPCPTTPEGLDLRAVLRALVQRDIHALLVEGGARVHRSFLDAGLVDRVILYVAPVILAGGPGWVAGPGVPALVRAHRLKIVHVEALGSDLRIELVPVERSPTE